MQFKKKLNKKMRKNLTGFERRKEDKSTKIIFLNLVVLTSRIQQKTTLAFPPETLVTHYSVINCEYDAGWVVVSWHDVAPSMCPGPLNNPCCGRQID